MSHAPRSRRHQPCRSQPQASQHKTYRRFISSDQDGTGGVGVHDLNRSELLGWGTNAKFVGASTPAE